jgi:hypothetical protein
MFWRRLRHLQGDLHQSVKLNNTLEKYFALYNCILAASVNHAACTDCECNSIFRRVIHYDNKTVIFITAYSLHVVKKLYVDM